MQVCLSRLLKIWVFLIFLGWRESNDTVSNAAKEKFQSVAKKERAGKKTSAFSPPVPPNEAHCVPLQSLSPKSDINMVDNLEESPLFPSKECADKAIRDAEQVLTKARDLWDRSMAKTLRSIMADNTEANTLLHVRSRYSDLDERIFTFEALDALFNPEESYGDVYEVAQGNGGFFRQRKSFLIL